MYVVCVKMAGVWEEDEESPELKIAEKEWCKTEDEMMKVTMYVSYRASAESKVAREWEQDLQCPKQLSV